MTAAGGGDPKLAPWTVCGEELLFEAPRLRLVRERVRLQDGRLIEDYYRIVMGEAAVVAARRRDGLYVMLEMYKHGPRSAGLGFPGGGIERGEPALAAAQRELAEETGYVARHWQRLGGYAAHSNQGCGFVHFFSADEAECEALPSADDLEPHNFIFLDRDEIRLAVRENRLLSMGHVCMATLLLSLTDA